MHSQMKINTDCPPKAPYWPLSPVLSPVTRYAAQIHLPLLWLYLNTTLQTSKSFLWIGKQLLKPFLDLERRKTNQLHHAASNVKWKTLHSLILGTCRVKPIYLWTEQQKRSIFKIDIKSHFQRQKFRGIFVQLKYCTSSKLKEHPE